MINTADKKDVQRQKHNDLRPTDKKRVEYLQTIPK